MSQHEYDTEVETADGEMEITIVYTFRKEAAISGFYSEDEVELNEVLVATEGYDEEPARPEIFRLVSLQFDRWYDQLCAHARGL